MNERIKELAEQAWEYAMAVHDGHIVPPLNKEVWPIDKVLDEKFAELIVRECVEKLKETKKVELPFLQAVNEYAQELPLSVYIAELNGHFGVEE